MARIRTIKPEFPQSESMGRVSRDARLLFVMLWTISDDTGRARAASRMLASLLFPYDDDAAQKIPEWLLELEREKCIRVYSVDGNTYLQIEKWADHQKIDHPSASKFPSPPEKIAKPRERSRNSRLGPRTKDQGKDLVPLLPETSSGESVKPKVQTRKGEPDGFQAFYEVFPKHVARRTAAKAYASALTRASPEVILAGAQRYALSCVGKEPVYVKQPDGWLNADRWADELPTVAATNGGGDPKLRALQAAAAERNDAYERELDLARAQEREKHATH